jgi:hypothetical protein
MATKPTEFEIYGPEEKKSWKERRKERKERRRLQGVYSMANPHMTGIAYGRSKKPMKITIDLDDDDFYQSFVPRAAQPAGPGPARNTKARVELPPSLHLDDGIDQLPQSPEQRHHRRRLTKRPRDLIGKCTVDMGIETLNLGVTFSPTSFIREGNLATLIDILTSNNAPLRPDPTYLCGINLTPLMEMDVFLQNLDKVFEGLLALISDIPSDGYEESLKDWDSLSRSAGRHITWLYLQSPEEGRRHLSSFIKRKVLVSLTTLKSREMPVTALNISLLSLTWFCLESSVRSGHRLFEESSEPLDLNPAHASLRLLLHLLVGYGFRKPYRVTRKNQVLDETKMSSYAAQMWVCLFHLLPACHAHTPTNLNKENPLWMELLFYYQNSPLVNSLEIGEGIWKAVFTLMALSQFSVLGIAGSNFRLSASWSLVAYAVKQVQLAQSKNNDQHLGRDTLEKRDKYIQVVISRCYRLLDYWKWMMDQSFGALNQLVDIFRVRNFINLHGEKAEYPDFMLDTDWDLLSQLRSETDSAFTSILKLFMRAVDSDCLTKPEIKKMVAIIIPVSRFKPQREKLPGAEDLSPICNRFAALALTIAIEQARAVQKVNQVQSSIDFSAFDSSTQLLTIRGVKLLASLMIKKDVPLREVAKWLTAMIATVASEFKTLRSTAAAQDKQKERTDKIRNHSLLILSLHATGRHLMETFAAKARYPDASFIREFSSL